MRRVIFFLAFACVLSLTFAGGFAITMALTESHGVDCGVLIGLPLSTLFGGGVVAAFVVSPMKQLWKWADEKRDL